MNTHERFLLAEHQQRVDEAERRGALEVALRELRRNRPTLRQRAAEKLLELAYRLSPETRVSTGRTGERRVPARGRI